MWCDRNAVLSLGLCGSCYQKYRLQTYGERKWHRTRLMQLPTSEVDDSASIHIEARPDVDPDYWLDSLSDFARERYRLHLEARK